MPLQEQQVQIKPWEYFSYQYVLFAYGKLFYSPFGENTKRGGRQTQEILLLSITHYLPAANSSIFLLVKTPKRRRGRNTTGWCNQ